MKNLLFIILIIMSLTKTYAQENVFQISYQVDNKSEKYGEADLSSPIPNPMSENLIIQLQADASFIILQKKNVLKKYDFVKEMIYEYNTDTLYNAVPLHSVIDYRIAEYANRIVLTDVMKAGGIENAFGDLADLESFFGVENQENNIKDAIKLQVIENTKVYSFGDNELVQIQFSKTKIPDAFLESFAKFLTYTTKIHPSIQKEIVKTKLVPECIQYSYVDVAVKSTKIYVLQESKNNKIIPKKVFYKDQVMVQRDASTMLGVIDSMMNYTMFNKVKPLESTFYFDEADTLFENDDNLSGLLCLFEYIFHSGDQNVEHMRKVALKQESDRLLAAFLHCTNTPESQEEAESKISILNSLIDLDLKYGYIMNVYAAVYVQSIDQSEAISYFYKALSKKPELNSPWLDLGKIYASMYEFENAWKCYEIMLQINSNHPNAKELIDKKEKLILDYPEYFKIN